MAESIDPKEYLAILKEVPLFKRLKEEEITLFLKDHQAEQFKMSEVIFNENDKGDAIFIILSGVVSISKKITEGEETTLTTLGPGEYFGEMSLLDGSPRSASAKLINDGTLIRFDRSDLNRVLKKTPSVAFKIIMAIALVFCERLRETNEKFKNITSKSVTTEHELDSVKANLLYFVTNILKSSIVTINSSAKALRSSDSEIKSWEEGMIKKIEDESEKISGMIENFIFQSINPLDK